MDYKPKTIGKLPPGSPQICKDLVVKVTPDILDDEASGLKEKGKLLSHGDDELVKMYIEINCPTLTPIVKSELKNWIEKHPEFNFIKEDPRIKFDKNGTGMDILVVNEVNKKYKLLQTKLRLADLHFTTTRRTGGKNEGEQSKSGQVAYRTNEFDIAVFITPSVKITSKLSNYSLSNFLFMCFGVGDLENHENPGFCVKQIGKGLIKKHGVSVEYILKLQLS